jgi:hypothetical protein
MSKMFSVFENTFLAPSYKVVIDPLKFLFGSRKLETLVSSVSV